MLIRMLVGLAGTPALRPGDQHDFPQDEAIRFVTAGFAVPVTETKLESADALPAPERRAKKGKANVVPVQGHNPSD